MNFNQLYTFYLVASSKSYIRASEKLFVTEPAVRIQIKALEKYMGGKLLEGRGSDLKLTELGSIVYSHCRRMFAYAEKLRDAIKEYGSGKTGLLRLGMAKVLLTYFMSRILPLFIEKYPHVKVQLEEDSTMDLMDGLLSGKYDLVLSASVFRSPSAVRSIQFTSARLLLVVSPKSSLGQRQRIKPEELASLPLIVRDEKSATRFMVLTALDRLNIKPLISLEVANTELIKELVKENKGVSFLPDLCVREEVAKKKLKVIEVEGLDFVFDINIYFLKRRTLPTQASSFLDYILSIKKPDICSIVASLPNQRVSGASAL